MGTLIFKEKKHLWSFQSTDPDTTEAGASYFIKKQLHTEQHKYIYIKKQP